MRFILPALLLLAPAEPSPVETEEIEASIAGLEVRAGENSILVSFRVDGAFSSDVAGRIDAGISVTFEHRVELVSRRAIPLIPSRVLARAEVASTVRYDSLTRQYYLSRRFSLEADGEDSPTIRETREATASEAEMREWMTSLRDVRLPLDPDELSRRLRVRVRCVLGRRYRLLIFPGNETVDAEKELVP